jgi:hypothetical protein
LLAEKPARDGFREARTQEGTDIFGEDQTDVLDALVLEAAAVVV